MFATRTHWKLQANAFTQALNEAKKHGQKLLDLTVSNPTEAGFSYSAAVQRSWQFEELHSYDPQPQGSLAARRAVCEYYGSRGESVSPEQIFLTVGTSEAYSFLFRLLCDPGDNILVPAPSYPLLQFLADIQDVRLMHYPLLYDQGWHIDFHTLRTRIDSHTRAVIVVNPNNPTGSYLHGHEAPELSAVCHENGLALIADEVFLDYSFTEQHASLVTNRDCLTFVMSGVSKISALPQMKAGWLAMNGTKELCRQAAERLEVITDTYLSVSAPTQLALPAMLAERHNVQPQIMGRLRSNLDYLDQQLPNIPECSRLAVDGGWYAVLRVPAICSDEDWVIRLIQQASVIVHPGHFFDFSADGYLVVSLLTPTEIFSQGMGRLLKFVKNSA